LDRMEVLEIPGYTENEKEHIAREHLLPKQMEINGIPKGSLTIQKGAMSKIINNYTKEAGVRSLERCIGRICRKTARAIMEEGRDKVNVTGKTLSLYLGQERYHYKMANKKDEIGIARGLAWTQVGGDTLQIEVNVMPGKGELMLTGQLGDVMKESARTGISYIRSVAKKYGISPEFFRENDIHIHIPEGAVPKDGPSAGITMATAMLSAIVQEPVRWDVAMTGEITLRGRVLPIGGLKEKLLAAKYARLKEVLVPKENKADILEMDEEITEGLKISFVETMGDVLGRALAERK
ncbi:MAG: S16 family serine protease, partial [Eubacteriales bacterium]|nr:S16 family serine protease [Eubacteriales bacterium]